MSLTVEKCLLAWTNSLRQMKIKADVVFFGDSLTYFGNFSSAFPNKVVCNLGLRGDTIQGMINRIEQVKMLHPKTVFLMAGINDIAYCTAGVFEKLYECLLYEMVKVIPKSVLIVESILPVNSKDYNISCNNTQIIECNKIIAGLTKKFELQLLDLFSLYIDNGLLPSTMTKDGIHLLPNAYRKWIDTLGKVLDE